jgi:dienelactone hydrolase
MRCYKLFFGFVLLSLILFSSVGCQKKEKKQTPQKQEKLLVVFDTGLSKGIVLTDVKSRADTLISYALYLPSGYTTSKKWPVIFCFDAQSRGKLPLMLYKDLAEKYGYILIGSNNSRNGMEWSTNKEQIAKMVNDAIGRLAINQQRLYTMGFSGGARVACQVAIDLAKIQGVIGCAAGFPQLEKQIETDFCYIGFSGDEDFNRMEMIRLDESLSTSGIPYFINFYKGKHDWPPATVMNEGFLWLEFNAYRNNLAPVNQSLVLAFYKQTDEEAIRASKSKNTWELYHLLKKAFVFLNSLTDISVFNRQLAELERSEKMKKIKILHQEMQAHEVQKQEEYRNYLNSKSIEWWKKEVELLNAAKRNKSGYDESAMAKRLLNYISLMTNLGATSALNNKQPEAAAYFLEIYSLVDPENPDYFYLSAYFYALQGNTEKSLLFLKRAVKYGYKDKNKLLSDATFSTIRQQKDFEEIINSIKD